MFKFIETRIKDLYIIEPKTIIDDNEYFVETYNKNEFFKAGLTMDFIQENESNSRNGVIRGLHFQKKYSQGKLVRVLSGEVYDVAVDLRVGSPTFSQWEGVYLSEYNRKQLYIPEGFAHGFLVTSNEAQLCYKVTNFYYPEYEIGMNWNDMDIGIDWPIDKKMHILIAEKDKNLLSFKDVLQLL